MSVLVLKVSEVSLGIEVRGEDLAVALQAEELALQQLGTVGLWQFLHGECLGMGDGPITSVGCPQVGELPAPGRGRAAAVGFVVVCQSVCSRPPGARPVLHAPWVVSTLTSRLSQEWPLCRSRSFLVVYRQGLIYAVHADLLFNCVSQAGPQFLIALPGPPELLAHWHVSLYHLCPCLK